ncbi:MAG TPA: stimulus-sensing domain-containing protein [Stellaceae bacterium]|nr:stimulus-sensing domain-containing protein [Stellaceae bacterium]
MATATDEPRTRAGQGEAVAPSAEPREAASRRSRRLRRRLSPLTRRILAVNVLALALLGLGLLYLGGYRTTLINAELDALQTQGEISAAALAEGAVYETPGEPEYLIPELGRDMLKRLVEPAKARARLFDAAGTLVADSRWLPGPGDTVQVEALEAPEVQTSPARLSERVLSYLLRFLPASTDYPPYIEYVTPTSQDYTEVAAALEGEPARAVRRDRETGGLVLSVAVPIQRYKKVLGAILFSSGSRDIEKAIHQVRLEIAKVFLIVLSVTVLLSIYLAGTIARPIRRLAIAAERVRRGHGRQVAIPDLTLRRDEIGELSGALREMTDALWRRMDAIEHFAADVAHEIKNPLTSLKSAVETVVRVADPEKQRRLLNVVVEDVARLDRLISDISDASRLDAEMSRIELEPVPLDDMLRALVDVHEASDKDGAPRLELVLPLGHGRTPLTVLGMESRLGQVFRNLITNAISFSPAGGTIWVAAERQGDFVRVTIEDEGPGIPESKLEAIFDRFYTERPTGEKFGTHSGLGLSISKQIVEAHQGTIRAENRRDAQGRVVGARFVVLLPAA